MRAHAMSLRQNAWFWASAAVVLVLGWQALTVHVNYGGNWTGLFCTGQHTRLPANLEAGTWRNSSPFGYDGQYYRLLAHDPFLLDGTAAFLDGPLVRSRRILVPLSAWILVAGRPGLIDGAYVLVIAAFAFGGVYWLSSILIRQDRHAAFGLLFLAVPATIISIDRMTIDVALGALTAAVAYQLISGRDRGPALWLTLAAAGLVRETGLLLALGCLLAAAYRRDYRKALLWSSAALPALCWFAYLQFHALPPSAVAQAVPKWLAPHHWQFGILSRALHPLPYPYTPGLLLLAHVFDWIALAATAAAAVMGLLRLRTTRSESLRAVLGLHAVLLFVLIQNFFWVTPFGYARPLAPLFVLLLVGDGRPAGYRALARAALVSMLVDLRLFTEIKAQVFGILHRFVG
jgi:hypothetical protein